jgi:hypothetical protein
MILPGNVISDYALALESIINHETLSMLITQDHMKKIIPELIKSKNDFKLRGFNSPRLASQSAKRSYYGT